MQIFKRPLRSVTKNLTFARLGQIRIESRMLSPTNRILYSGSPALRIAPTECAKSALFLYGAFFAI